MIEGIKTKQDLFNFVARHLLQQNKTSMGVSGASPSTCAYRGVDGLKCAIGCLIENAQYNVDFECRSIMEPPVRNAVEVSIGRVIEGPGVTCGDYRSELDLLSTLQQTHDYVYPEFWTAALRMIAKKFYLELIPELEESVA